VPTSPFPGAGNLAGLVGVQGDVGVNGMVTKRRAQRALAVLLFGVSVSAFSGCSSGRSVSSGPSLSARAICTAVGRQLGAPPAVGPTYFLTAPVVAAGEHAGDAPLDAAVSQLWHALVHQAATAVPGAESGVETACARLGIWQVYH
jgi:hypothetical protein